MPGVSEILINVRGSHSVEVPPEVGVVHAEVRFAGASPEVVLDRLRHGVARVRERLEQLESDGAVDRVVIQQARTSIDRDGPKGRDWLKVVHRATVWFWADFVDFEELGVWVGRSATEEGVQVRDVSWRLAKETQLNAEREVRQEAVRQAKVRAQDYADALDLGPVSVRSINDVGFHRDVAYASMAVGPEVELAPELAFDPDDITVSAEVEAAFAVGS
ncbi:SIMPL domain-containing protein [Nocardioides albus]|nr:SIMPL domain-containing protein [Nocardioides albus]